MAAGVRERLGVDVGIAVTGVAGPDGGTEAKPVGLVYLHVSAPWGERGDEFSFPATVRRSARAPRRGAPPRPAASDTESARSGVTRAASVGDGDRLRLFLALQLPSKSVDIVADWQARHLDRGRLVPREHLHVTLAFLGTRPALGAAGDRRRPPEHRRRRRRAPARAARAGARPGAWGWSCSTIPPAERPRSRSGSTGGSPRSASTGRRLARGSRTSRCCAFASARGSGPPLPETGTFVPSGAAAYLSRLHPSGARYEVLDRVSLNAGG